jgi:hypothetical protein
MKKLLLASLLFACMLMPAYAFTSRSLLFADSYMLRARGCDANYWNPALLNKADHDIWIPGLNTGVYAGNNTINLDLYNFVMTQDYLEEDDKQRILDAIDDRIAIDLGANVGLFGFTAGSVAISSALHLATKAGFDEQYIKLLLYGNGDGSETYDFTEENNYVQALSYLDLTVGVGNIRLPLPKVIPDIKFGLAVSALGGIGGGGTEEFDGYLSSNIDGFTVHQDIHAKGGAGGYGAKGLIGLYSEPLQGLRVGATLDNILGFIKWEYESREADLHLAVDSLYALDIEEDFYTYEFNESQIDPFTTKLPMEMRLAAMYRIKPVSLSLDYIQGFDRSAATSSRGRFAIGAEIRPWQFLPIQIGCGTGTGDYLWRTSYGLGFDFKAIEFGIGIQSIESLIPSPSTKGIAVATYFNLRL